jgi:hypothetical protein
MQQQSAQLDKVHWAMSMDGREYDGRHPVQQKQQRPSYGEDHIVMEQRRSSRGRSHTRNGSRERESSRGRGSGLMLQDFLNTIPEQSVYIRPGGDTARSSNSGVRERRNRDDYY